MPAPSPFRVITTDRTSQARLGELITPHGTIPTPIFMPVGTQGTVKGIPSHDLLQLNTPIILANTYHLLIRPGKSIIEHFGGLHTFMQWPRPILTDSGGYQVFSLARLRKISCDGVHFQSHVNGAPFFLGPREALEMQRAIGSDIAMVLDVCPPWDAPPIQMREAVMLTLSWAQQARQIWPQLLQKENIEPQSLPRPLLFGIVQGGSNPTLRAHCAQSLVEKDFDSYAIGGVSVGEPQEEMYRAVELTIPHLPPDKARYTMGLGHPHQIVELVARGVDMFDCVLPTRMARHGTAYTSCGPINLKRSVHALSHDPIDPSCACAVCMRYSRGYVHHLFRAGEMLAQYLTTYHNLAFYLELTRKIRETLAQGTFSAFREAFTKTYSVPNEREP
ncbi:MAG: tRNA guanosine(34) transglycosylase Tgt [Methylacidiphilales bacterium]|nr:tRNA guanosine(34) transglycosylase Tgt [Candidatus Methylacidiphilales bacterium]MDW8349983.1 tRNA guanosine(34) transglycosylase Tgt [Verrucomicrobiae bacterium]